MVNLKYRTGISAIGKVKQIRDGQLKVDESLDGIVRRIVNGDQYKTEVIEYLRENAGKRETDLLN